MNVISGGKHAAMIVKLPRAADAYRAEEPWALLHNNGRVDRFPTQREAKDEAIKSYGTVRFTRGNA